MEYSHHANALRNSSAPVMEISPVDIMPHDVTFEHIGCDVNIAGIVLRLLL